jgi:hypothetical protein
VAVGSYDPVKTFDDWYERRDVDDRNGTLRNFTIAECAVHLRTKFDRAKREMDIRVNNYDNLIKLVDAEVISQKPDLPNVSSGEVAGMIRRMARNLVQNTPNVDIISKFDDDSPAGIFVNHILKSRIIGDDFYSNDMQQNLYASAKNSLTLGFDTVIPVLAQDAAGGWIMKYDNIFYRDVFPDPGVKDIREAKECFIRRYLTKADVVSMIRNKVIGWDIEALSTLVQTSPPARDERSVDQQTKKHHQVPYGYEIITYYNSYGDPFLTWDARNGMLLRIEQNRDPLKRLPVHFLVMEKDLNQPLGKSQVELVVGRQEFQDLMLNGAMKMWYRNINPPILGMGWNSQSAPNLGPGKFTPMPNPNAELKPLEVSTQTLLQYGTIATQNAGNMVQLLGAADQQMAAMNGGNGGMSQTPQGVQAQQQMVDITTNNYQKAIENFFSRYCSYALTVYFAELKGSVKQIQPTADARRSLLNGGLRSDPITDEMGKVVAPADFLEDGTLNLDFDAFATEYFVRTVPGSLVEIEDEKQLRILQQIYVPLSQAMPALAASGNQQALANATAAMQFIVQKTIELSGSTSAHELRDLMSGRAQLPEIEQQDSLMQAFEDRLGAAGTATQAAMDQLAAAQKEQQNQIALLRQGQGAMMQHLGIPEPQTAPPTEDLSYNDQETSV